MAPIAGKGIGLETYDYIVVGAGSAGCVVANRLSERGSNSVLLIESGPPDRHPYLHIPRGYARLLGVNDRLVWSYPASRGPKVNVPEYVVRGRVLGGSSAINGMMYMRGLSEDFDDWQMPNWSWNDISRAYRAIENVDGNNPAGPLRIVNPHYDIPICDAVLAAARDSGIDTVADLNAADGECMGYTATNIWRGWRQSSAKAFLTRDVRRLRNLHVLTDADVDRLCFEGRKVAAVDVIVGGERRRIRAGREVIVSAGALASPKLLMRSGVGPAGDLRRLGIDVVLDSPHAGRNMADHRMLLHQFSVSKGSQGREFSGWRLYRNALRQLLLGTGPIARPAFEVNGYVRTDRALARPDVQLMMGPFRVDRTGNEIAISREHGACIGGYQTRPESRGVLRLTGAAADAPLDIQPNMLEAEADRRTILATTRFVRALFKGAPLKDFSPAEVYPGPEVDSDDAILELFERTSSSAYHVSGTCRMGRESEGVVDDRLRVQGLDGLRVVDISVMARPTSGNTNAPAMAIGWRASDLILADSVA